MTHRNEKGMVAIYTALVLLFLVGSVAFAADTSGFFRMARADQTSADLACLAGAQELPGSPSAALTIAAENVKTNFPRVASATAVTTSNQAVLTVGANVVTINTNWTGDPKKMRVQVTSSEPRTFSRIWSSANVPVTQQAVCQANPAAAGPGMLPMGAYPGGFLGALHDCAAKVTGNCGALDSGSGGSGWRAAIANGLDGDFEKHWGNYTVADSDTGHVGTKCASPFSSFCNAIDTEPGNMVGPFRQGVTDRLNEVAGATCVQNGTFNCDSLAQVLGASPSTLGSAFGSAPSWWIPSIYGAYATYSGTHYYYDGDIDKCDSPRLATIPIVALDEDWDIGDPAGGTWPNGKKLMKIVGFYTVYIREPSDISEIGAGPILADVIWFGPNATCDGNPVQFYGGPPVSGSFKLVAS